MPQYTVMCNTITCRLRKHLHHNKFLDDAVTVPCVYMCNGVEWSKDRTQAAESIKWRPQQAYGSNRGVGGVYLLSCRQFSAHTKSSLARIDKRKARAAGNTCYHRSKIAHLDHKMADNCVSLARTNTVSSTITKPIKT